jgi:hypothetical protein
MKERQMLLPEIKNGTILVHSIGSGCDSFYQVVSRSDKRLRCREIQYRAINVRPKFQTCDIVPLKDEFRGDKVTSLAISEQGRIGPIKRLMGWRVWDGKKLNQYSN